MTDTEDKAWVVVRRSLDPVSIELVRAALDMSGIRSRQRNEMMASMLPLHQNAIGGFELEVRAADEDAARARIAEFDASEHDASLAEDAEDSPEAAPLDATAEGDAAMRRAAAAAILGLVMCFGTGGFVSLVIMAGAAGKPLSVRGRTYMAFALVFSVLGFALVARLMRLL